MCVLPISARPNVTDKALKDFAYRVLCSDYDNLKIMYPGVTIAELSFFCDQLKPDQLTEIYAMFFRTGLVQ